MRFTIILAILLVYSCFSVKIMAQWDAQISQYWQTKTYFNPSFAGSIDSIQAMGLYRQQWVGVEHAPKTFLVLADAPLNFLNRKHGVGISVMTESIGLFKNTIVGGQYVYKTRIKKNLINIGVQLGYVNMGFDASKIHIPDDQKDDIDATDGIGGNASAFDGNIGISFVNPKFYIGLSMTHITKPNFNFSDNIETYISRTYYLTAGYNLKFKHSKYEFKPSILIKTDAVATQYEATARIDYNKMFNGGISWRKDDGFVFLLGASFYGFEAGYAYDLSTSAIAKASKGTHEVFLRYTIPMKTKNKVWAKHKSIRIL